MLIDSEALKKAYCDYCNAMDPDMSGCPGECETHRIIDRQSPIDTESLRHAQWIDRGGIFECSNCSAESGVMTRYCSYCGYQMDGGDQDAAD